jgi:hypothetical protein
VLRLLGKTIRAVNDTWGVFSTSRIDLYEHQFWVCRKVTKQWPIRRVVADDVGLGKTIEAGLILWRRFHLDLIHRLLIPCPASLVQPWQERPFEMFDIRMAQYDSDQDSDRLDFWKLNTHVVASFHTLREDRDGRQLARRARSGVAAAFCHRTPYFWRGYFSVPHPCSSVQPWLKGDRDSNGDHRESFFHFFT